MAGRVFFGGVKDFSDRDQEKQICRKKYVSGYGG